MQPKNPALFYGAIIVAVLALICGIYYAIPGVTHILVSGAHPPQDPQPGHIMLFLAITFISVITALVTRPKKAAQ